MLVSILRKLFLAVSIAAGLSSGVALAQSDILSSFTRKVSEGRVDINYSYTLDGDVPVTSEGVAVLQKGKYQISFDGVRLWNDGISLWMADDVSKELYAEEIQPSDNLSNPVFLLTRMDSFGALSDPVNVSRDGLRYRSCSVKDLSGFPDTYESIEIFFKNGAWYPSMIVIGLANEMSLKIVLKTCSCDSALLPESSFTINPKEFKGYSFTDLREE